MCVCLCLHILPSPKLKRTSWRYLTAPSEGRWFFLHAAALRVPTVSLSRFRTADHRPARLLSPRSEEFLACRPSPASCTGRFPEHQTASARTRRFSRGFLSPQFRFRLERVRHSELLNGPLSATDSQNVLQEPPCRFMFRPVPCGLSPRDGTSDRRPPLSSWLLTSHSRTFLAVLEFSRCFPEVEKLENRSINFQVFQVCGAEWEP